MCSTLGSQSLNRNRKWSHAIGQEWTRKGLSVDIPAQISTDGSAGRSKHFSHHIGEKEQSPCLLFVMAKVKNFADRQRN